MKNLIIFPPQWAPFSPHLGPLMIYSNIKKAGYMCDFLDLNVNFYNEILTKEYMKNVLVKIYNNFLNIKEELNGKVDFSKSVDEYPLEFHIKAKEMLKINDIINNKTEETKKIIELIDGAVLLLRDNENFYDLKMAVNSLAIINKALDIISIEEFPQELSMYNLKNNVVLFDYPNILKYCESDNIFKRFYESKVNKIAKKKYDFIGISISSSTQLLAGLTLSKMLKESCKKTKICIGGNYISRIKDAVENHSEFLKTFSDYVIYEEGERAIKELLESINYKRSIKDVSSLIFLNKENKAEVNEKKNPIPLSELSMPNLTNIDLKKYFLPQIILPIQAGRGCYWKKCTFCDHYYGQTYNIKDIDILVNELKELKNKFGIINFEFTDDCISPDYLEKFSLKLIEENLNINWYCDLRLETAFTKEIFETAYKAGLKMILWGFESGSKRIMELINKGVDIDKRIEVMKRASDSGIFNFAYVFTGFPTETYQEAMETVNAVCNNTDVIHAYGRSIFTLGKHSIININPQKFSIVNVNNDEDFSSDIPFELTNGLSQDELNKINNEFTQKAFESYKKPAWMYLDYRELLFLYICKYGKDAVCQMKYE